MENVEAAEKQRRTLQIMIKLTGGRGARQKCWSRRRGKITEKKPKGIRKYQTRIDRC